MVPFRMTNQFVGLLSPLDAQGLLRHYLCMALGCLRAGSVHLVRAMDVFLNEPLVDWAATRSELRRPREDGEEAAEVEAEGGGRAAAASAAAPIQPASTWAPRYKVDSAAKRIRGVHPVDVLVEELARNPHKAVVAVKPHIVKCLHEVAPGGGAGGGVVPVAEQADALLRLATDPRILARMWTFWMPHV